MSVLALRAEWSIIMKRLLFACAVPCAVLGLVGLSRASEAATKPPTPLVKANAPKGQARANDDQIRQNIQDLKEQVVGMNIKDAVAKMKKLGGFGDGPFLDSADEDGKTYHVVTNENWDYYVWVFHTDSSGKIRSFRTHK